MTEKIRFSVDRAIVGNFTDVAWVEEGEDPTATVVAAAFQQMATDIEIRVGGITMHVAAWQDPDHWESDWREATDIDDDQDVHDYISGLLHRARED